MTMSAAAIVVQSAIETLLVSAPSALSAPYQLTWAGASAIEVSDLLLKSDYYDH